MAEFDAREQFTAGQVAFLATASGDGVPHVVPVVFAVAHDVVYTAVDTKRKTTHRLRRLVNIEQNPQVSMLVDHYADEWDQLWWVRADGVAEIHDRGEAMEERHAPSSTLATANETRVHRSRCCSSCFRPEAVRR